MKTLSLPSLWIIAIALGVGAGTIGTALTFSYLRDYSVVLEDLSGPINLTGERATKKPQNFSEAIEVVQEKVAPASVEIFTVSSEANGVYETGQGQAGGFFITSDGWLVTAISNYFSPSVGSSVVIFNQEIFPVQKVLFDSSVGIAFLKIEATNLPVVSFGDPLLLSSGDNLFTVFSKDSLLVSSFYRSENFGVISRPAETAVRRLVLDQDVDNKQVGAAVANSSGEVVGVLVTGEKSLVSVLPFTVIRAEIFSLLKEGKISLFFLGANITNLQEVVGYPETKTRGYNYGELIEGVTIGGPAASAGLKRGDIILKVGNETLNGVFLDELLANYHPGDTVVLTIDREGTKQEFEIILGEREES